MAEPAPHFSMANILRAQQELLSGGGRAPAEPGPARAQGAESPEAVHYIQVLKRWWLWSLLAALVVVGVTVASEYARTPVYTARTRILITQSVFGGGLSEELGSRRLYLSASTVAKLSDLPSTRKRISERLVRWRMSEGAQEAQGGEAMPAINRGEVKTSPGRLGSASFQDSLVGIVSARADEEDVSVQIAATVEGESKLAVAIANAAAYALVEEFNDKLASASGLDKVKKARDRNQGQLEALDAEIRKLNAERLTALIEGLPADPDELLRLYGEVERLRQAVEMDLAQAREILAGLEQADLGKTTVDPAPPHLVARLIDLELTLEGYEKRYTDSHPKMLKVREEIETVKRAIERYRGKVSGLGSRQQDALAMEIIRERARVAGLKARAQRLGAKREVIRETVSRSVGASKDTELDAKLRERRIAEELAFALGGQLLRSRALEDEAEEGHAAGMEVIPAKGASPDGTGAVTLALGMLIALVAGCMTALALEHLDVTVRSAMDVKTVGGLSTIGVVPLFETEEFIVPEEPRSRAAEAFSMLRNAVRYASRNEPERLLMVTSPGPKEGKSYVSTNLAVSFAQEGNTVVLVDADMRKGTEPLLTQAAAPAMGSLDLGLTSYLEGGLSADEILVPTAVPNLFVIPSGGTAANPASALRSERMGELMEDLQGRFNVVILDTPPMLPVVDSALMAPLVRGTLMVVHSGSTRSGELSEAVSRLRHVDAPLIGAVLNRATPVNTGAAYTGYSSYDQYVR